MNQGWIKLHRQIADNPLWKCESFSRGQAWVDLILLANHKNSFFYKRGIKIDVKRGQLGISEKGLSDRWKWSRNKVKKFLKDLEKEHQIKIEKSNVTQVVTVLNYDEFQQEKTPSGTPNDTPKGHQKDTYKNDNKEKKINNISSSEFRERTIKYLNIKLKTKFRDNTNQTIKDLEKIWKEKYTLNDIKKVLDYKINEWKEDTEMKKYLVPSTLFRFSNFEKYLESASNYIEVKPAQWTNDPRSGQFC